jgi:hypothetical protein
MVRPRRGASTLGCLFTLLIVVSAGYVGFRFGEVYWRYYQYKDDMTQQLRFASHNTDAQISRHMAAVADSLGRPAPAGRVVIRRTDRSISIESEYVERVEVPLYIRSYIRDIPFNPRVEGTY